MTLTTHSLAFDSLCSQPTTAHADYNNP